MQSNCQIYRTQVDLASILMLTGLTAVLSDDFHTRFCQVASALRASGKTVNLMLQKKDVRAEILCDNSFFFFPIVTLIKEHVPLCQAKSSFSFADRAGASRCAFVAPAEWGDAKTSLKDRRVRIKVRPLPCLPYFLVHTILLLIHRTSPMPI